MGRVLFDDHLMTLLPLSVYLSTKLWFYVTWLAYIAPVVSSATSFCFLVCSALLWYCFWNAWRGDPGIIEPTQEQRFRVKIYMKFEFSSEIINWFYILDNYRVIRAL